MLLAAAGPGYAAERGAASAAAATIGGAALGDAQNGVAERAFVVAPPHYRYVLARRPGSFVTCGDEAETRSTDGAGRDLAPMTCRVTLTETVVIPAAAESAQFVIHY